MVAKEIEVRLRIAAPMAALAFDQRIGAVQFDQPLRARAGQAVQAVDVLRHDHLQFAGFLQLDDGIDGRR